MSNSIHNMLKASASVLALTLIAPAAMAQGNELITKDANNGEPFAQDSLQPTTSADGQTIAFSSYADELIGGYSPYRQVFIQDRATGTFKHIHITDTDGSELNGDFHSPKLSADGLYVILRFTGSPGEYTFNERLYFYDRQSQNVELITDKLDDIHGASSNRISITDDGNKIAFASRHGDIVSGDTNNLSDVFVYDRTNGTTERVSLAYDGGEVDNEAFGPMISGDGSAIVFSSGGGNITEYQTPGGIFLRDLTSGENIPIDVEGSNEYGDNAYPDEPYITSDGTFVVYTRKFHDGGNQSYAGSDVWLFNTLDQSSTRVSDDKSFGGNSNNNTYFMPSVSDDGNYVAFGTLKFSDDQYAFPEAHLYVVDRANDEKRLITPQATFLPGSYGDLEFTSQMARDGQSFVFTSEMLFTDPNPGTFSSMQIFQGTTTPSNTAPIANAGPDVLATLGEAQLDGTGSSDDYTPSANLTYQWQSAYLLGEPYQGTGIMGALTATPTVNLGGLSPEMFKLSVMDEHGLISAMDYVLVEPGNTPPSAYAGPDQSGLLGETFTLNGAGSYDPDGDPLTYSWSLYNQPAGSTATLSSNQVSTSFTPDLPGVYSVVLTVNDG